MNRLIFIVSILILNSSFTFNDDYLTLLSIQHDGLKRTFYLHLPTNFDELELLPVVLILHGGGKADGYKTAEHTGYNKIADREGFIAVYPNGIDSQWNDGRGKTFRKKKGNENIDDVGFISSLIDYLIENYKVDPKRIYVTGLSNGGMMTLRLGCELASKLAAIAPVIANMPEKIVSDCNPDDTLPVLIMNGTADPLVPWEGGYVKFLGRKMGKVISTENTVRFWVEHNKCFEKPVTEVLPDLDEDDDSRINVITYNNSEDGVEVILYAIKNGGHNFPGANTPELKFLLGNKNNDINGSEIIWRFFSNHKK
jgi:polyhydroxybutyrate depolymerase